MYTHLLTKTNSDESDVKLIVVIISFWFADINLKEFNISSMLAGSNQSHHKQVHCNMYKTIFEQ